MSGFELFVVLSLFEISSWQALERFNREERVSSAINAFTSSIAAIVLEVYWLWVAVWPVIK